MQQAAAARLAKLTKTVSALEAKLGDALEKRVEAGEAVTLEDFDCAIA